MVRYQKLSSLETKQNKRGEKKLKVWMRHDNWAKTHKSDMYRYLELSSSSLFCSGEPFTDSPEVGESTFVSPVASGFEASPPLLKRLGTLGTWTLPIQLDICPLTFDKTSNLLPFPDVGLLQKQNNTNVRSQLSIVTRLNKNVHHNGFFQ